MDRFAAKEKEIDIARLDIEQLSRLVKDLTAAVKDGNASKAELSHAINTLEHKTQNLKILTQEAKVLGGWAPIGSVSKAPPEDSPVLVYVLVSILLLVLIS